MSRNEQYRLHAYVCGNACLQTVDNIGTLSFAMVFVKRPAECRYAIVSHYDVNLQAEQVLVWDLYDAQEQLRTGGIVPPKPCYIGDSVDAAIMATFMTYEDD